MVLCSREYLVPLELLIHTSKPLSTSLKAMDCLPFIIHCAPECMKSCYRITTFVTWPRSEMMAVRVYTFSLGVR